MAGINIKLLEILLKSQANIDLNFLINLNNHYKLQMGKVK